jgi:hypothetical protein
MFFKYRNIEGIRLNDQVLFELFEMFKLLELLQLSK